MDRMTFREMIRPLSSYEEELKRTQSSNRLMEQSIQYAYKKDKDGYYFSPIRPCQTREAIHRIRCTPPCLTRI